MSRFSKIVVLAIGFSLMAVTLWFFPNKPVRATASAPQFDTRIAAAVNDDAVLKGFMVQKALEIAAKKYKASFDPRDTKLMRSAEIPEAFKFLHRDLKGLPDGVQKGLRNKNVVALFIPQLKLPAPKGGALKMYDRRPPVMLTIWANDWPIMEDGGCGGAWIPDYPPEPDECGGLPRCNDHSGELPSNFPYGDCLCIWIVDQCPPCGECTRCSSAGGAPIS